VLAGSLGCSAETELVVPHYFCESLNGPSKQTLSFYVSVLIYFCQIVILYPQLEGIIDDLLALFPAANARARHDLDQLSDVLDSIFAKSPDITVIVDALDECRGQDAKQLFPYLQSLSQRPQVRVIILSRQRADMETVFPDAEIIMMDRAKVELDIKHYVKARIRRNESLQAISKAIFDKVTARCHELFLWVKFMLDDLEKADTLNDQLEALNQFPPDLFDAFERLLVQTRDGSTPKQKKICDEIFLLLVGARRSLTVEEVSSLIALDVHTNSIDKGNEFLNPLATLQKLCGPFVITTEDRVRLAHTAVKEFLVQRQHTRLDDSNAYLAEKCLSKLIQEKYSQLQYAAALLRDHLLPKGLADSEKLVDNHTVPYEYAAQYWQDHLVSLSDPSDSILNKLKEFITGIAAVTWSERLVDVIGGGDRANIVAEVAVLATLTDWAKGLPPSARKRIPIDDFFVLAHNRIRKELSDNGQDTLLSIVPAIRLGQFFNVGGKSYAEFQKAYDYKKIVVDGFTKVLGQRSPLTLSARTTLLVEYFWQGRMDEAEMELTEVAAIELEVLGKDSVEYFRTLQLLGSAQCYLTNYEDACSTLQKSGDGLRSILGSDSQDYLVNLLYNGYAMERQANLLEARRMYETIWTIWTPVMGKTHPLSLMAQAAVSSVYRKEGDYKLARDNLELAWEARQRLFSLNSNTTVDSGIQLAITYREMSLHAEALQLLDEIEMSNVLETDFERTCQVAHIRAIIAFDQGDFDKPRVELTKLLDRTIGKQRDMNDRECLWIRITLADALRQHGDDAEALMLFSELVKPTKDDRNSRSNTPPLADEPEPPTQLALAEEALRLVKKADVVGADELLAKNDLQWFRRKDFWIRQGGPIADTAWMKPVELALRLVKPQHGD